MGYVDIILLIVHSYSHGLAGIIIYGYKETIVREYRDRL